MNILVIGASRGLGLEFVRQYRAAGDAVTATARSEAGLQALRALGATALRLDVTDEAGVAGLGAQLGSTKFDVAIVNAGVGGPRGAGLPPEAEFDVLMRTNVLGPMRVLPTAVAALAKGGKVAVLSSRMGSIGSRTAAGMSPYRASKAAVNSVMKDAALDYAGKAIVVSLHPGWVRTDMGGAGADIDAATSIAGMREVIAGLSGPDNGGFFNYDGQPIAF